jgi:hypothetical protein
MTTPAAIDASVVVAVSQAISCSGRRLLARSMPRASTAAMLAAPASRRLRKQRRIEMLAPDGAPPDDGGDGQRADAIRDAGEDPDALRPGVRRMPAARPRRRSAAAAATSSRDELAAHLAARESVPSRRADPPAGARRSSSAAVGTGGPAADARARRSDC